MGRLGGGWPHPTTASVQGGAERGWAGARGKAPTHPSPARRGRPPPPSGPLPTSRPPPPAPAPLPRQRARLPPPLLRPPALRPLSLAPSRSLLSAIEGRRELQPVNRVPPLSSGATAAAPPAPAGSPRRPGASPGPARPAPTRRGAAQGLPPGRPGRARPALEARTRRPRGARPGARGPRPRAPCPRPRPALRSPAPLPGLSCGTDAGPPATRVRGQRGSAG